MFLSTYLSISISGSIQARTRRSVGPEPQPGAVLALDVVQPQDGLEQLRYLFYLYRSRSVST